MYFSVFLLFFTVRSALVSVKEGSKKSGAHIKRFRSFLQSMEEQTAPCVSGDWIGRLLGYGMSTAAQLIH